VSGAGVRLPTAHRRVQLSSAGLVTVNDGS
jgi:hypothetical protein